MSDGDPFGSDEDVFDEQPQHALAVFDVGVLGLVAELGEEAFQVGGECEVGAYEFLIGAYEFLIDKMLSMRRQLRW